MGYRLETYKLDYLECGGKLYGYLDEETLFKLRSWNWLLTKGYIEKDAIWEYSASHETVLYQDEFREFIMLYIEDYNQYSPYGNKLTIDDFKDTLKEFRVVICWE